MGLRWYGKLKEGLLSAENWSPVWSGGCCIYLKIPAVLLSPHPHLFNFWSVLPS